MTKSDNLFSNNLSGNEILLSTDIDQLAIDTGKNNDLDFVSITEYLINLSITYPYTFYNGLSEVPFASCITVNFDPTGGRCYVLTSEFHRTIIVDSFFL